MRLDKYRVTDKATGQQYDVVVEVKEKEFVEELAARALASRSKRSMLMYGVIKCKLTPVPPERA